MLNNEQIKLVQTAVRKAGIRTPQFDGRYRILLNMYKNSDGRAVTSCRDLNNSQMEDLLAVCESHGWRMPGKPEDFYRKKIIAGANIASYAQQQAIEHLSGDLGWTPQHLNNFIDKQTSGMTYSVAELTPRKAFEIIEALKAMFNRKNGTNCNTLNQIKEASVSRISDKQAESETYALNGLREVVTDDTSKSK